MMGGSKTEKQFPQNIKHKKNRCTKGGCVRAATDTITFFLQEGKEGAPRPVWRGSKKDKEKLPPDIVVIGKKKTGRGRFRGRGVAAFRGGVC